MKKHMKSIRCKLGLHKPLEAYYMRITRQHRNGKKYHRNFRICRRCGKKLGTLVVRPIEIPYNISIYNPMQ